MPFIKILGYDPFNLSEVSPEIPAPFGIKQDQRADFGIMVEGAPAIIFEVKWCGKTLDEKDEDQLRRYFGGLKGQSNVAVLTNGVQYRFFTDKEISHVMDKAPFLEIDLLDLKKSKLNMLEKLTKLKFKPPEWPDAAKDLKYVNDVKRLLGHELKLPTIDFIKFCAARVEPEKKQTQYFIDWCTPLTRLAVGEFMRDQAHAIFQRAVDESDTGDPHPKEPPVPASPTEEEKEAYYIVRAILCQVVPPDKVHPRKSKNRLDILFENSNRRPLCRLYFDDTSKEIGLLDSNKAETRKPIEQLAKIYQFSDELRALAAHYMSKPTVNGNHADESEATGE